MWKMHNSVKLNSIAEKSFSFNIRTHAQPEDKWKVGKTKKSEGKTKVFFLDRGGGETKLLLL